MRVTSVHETSTVFTLSNPSLPIKHLGGLDEESGGQQTSLGLAILELLDCEKVLDMPKYLNMINENEQMVKLNVF